MEMKIPDEPFKYWLKRVIPNLQEKKSWVSAKSVKYGKTDQSMFSHVSNAVFAVHSLINAMELDLTAEEEHVIYAIITMHDLHKESPNKYHATDDEFISYARELGYDAVYLPDEMVITCAAFIDYLHKKEGREDRIDALDFEPDERVEFHLSRVADTIAGNPSIKSLLHVKMNEKGIREGKPYFMEQIDEMKKETGRFELVPNKIKNFPRYITRKFSGDLTATIQRFLNERMESDTRMFLWSCKDGSVFYDREAMDINESRLIQYVSKDIFNYGDLVKFSHKYTGSAISTLTENSKYMTLSDLLDSVNRELQSRFLIGGKFNQFTVNKIIEKDLFNPEPGKSLHETICEKFGEINNFKEIYSPADDPFTNEDFVIYSFIYMIRSILVSYKVVKSRNNTVDNGTLIKMFNFSSEDTKKINEINKKGNIEKDNASWFKFFLIPIAKVLRKRIFSVDRELSGYFNDITDFIKKKLKDYFDGENVLQSKQTDLTYMDNIVEVVKNHVSFNGSRKLVGMDLGIDTYIKGRERMDMNFKTKCFLCHETEKESLLLAINSNIALMKLQTQKDIIAGARTSISDNSMFKACFSCYLNFFLQARKYPFISKDNMEETWFITIYPDYIFTRSMTSWLAPVISSLSRIANKDITVDGPDVKMNEGVKGFFVSHHFVHQVVKNVVQYWMNTGKTPASMIGAAMKKQALKNMIEIIAPRNKKLGSKAKEWGAFLTRKEVQDDGIDTGAFDRMKNNWFSDIYSHQNYYIVPVTIPTKERDKVLHNDTSKSAWLLILATMISMATGCRVTVSSEYGKIKMISSRHAVTFDTIHPKITRLVGGTELGLKDRQESSSRENNVTMNIKEAFEIMALLVHSSVLSNEKPKPNNVVKLIDDYIDEPSSILAVLKRRLRIDPPPKRGGVETKGFKKKVENVTKLVLEIMDRAMLSGNGG
jgi:hypothetical protein